MSTCRVVTLYLQMTLEMLSTDTIAELRAEVTRWWQNLQKQHQQKLKELNENPNPTVKAAGNHSNHL